ncbi:hypothetical protein [Bacteroides cellulosilyticus]|uniref:hypothetical protein n=1 Tax=Bacteroides cellulosilyticus TaxID=246787 RepID=UPI00101E1353|nr:hypothetical protein [Bacteroides cellulosilyticus]
MEVETALIACVEIEAGDGLPLARAVAGFGCIGNGGEGQGVIQGVFRINGCPDGIDRGAQLISDAGDIDDGVAVLEACGESTSGGEVEGSR